MSDEAAVFGVFTDTHYSHKADDGQRFFASSLAKMEDLAEGFDKARVDFTVCLGDLIDHNEEEDARPRLGEILAAWGKAPGPRYLCFGNHDISALSREELLDALAPPYSGSYGSFDFKGLHFVVLDTNYDRDGRAYTHETMQWDCCCLDKAQLEWLEGDLKKSGGPVIVFAHADLDPHFADRDLDPCVLKNHEKVRGVLNSCGRVHLVLQGHYHPGRECTVGGVRYVTLPAVVDGKDKNHGLIVRCGLHSPPQWEELF